MKEVDQMGIKDFSLGAALAIAAVVGEAGEAKPVWELGKNLIDPATTKGKIELVDGVIKLDCTNSFLIPKDVFGKQHDYTIEFELRRSPKFKKLPRMEGALLIASNLDAKNHTGLSLIYFPPDWDLNGGVSNKLGMDVNAYWNGECNGLDGNDFNKYSIVVKDNLASIYRNGLLLAMTGEIKPSENPLTIGGQGWRGNLLPQKSDSKPVPEPYELRNLKIYDCPIAPTGYDHSTEMMRNYSGEGYTMQRADIKDSSLPRILVVGDSISMGYRRYITEHFKGRAYVDYWVGSLWFDWTVKKDDFPVLRSWDGVLSNGPYDVVSWNAMSLHMWGNKQKERCVEDRFPAQMTRVVDHLRKAAPDTKFIWVRCTPVTTPTKGGPSVIRTGNEQWLTDRIIKFNGLADEIMQKNNIPEVDLYALCEKNLDKASNDGVHWQMPAYKLMAKEIIKEIEKILPEKHVGAKKKATPGQK